MHIPPFLKWLVANSHHVFSLRKFMFLSTEIFQNEDKLMQVHSEIASSLLGHL